jgi:hypothetical protein
MHTEGFGIYIIIIIIIIIIGGGGGGYSSSSSSSSSKQNCYQFREFVDVKYVRIKCREF